MNQWTLFCHFQAAILSNDVRRVDCLLKEGIDFDYRFGPTKTPALCLSCQSGHFFLVKLLIDHGCSINQSDQNGYTALHFACNYIFVEIARLLIKHRANVDAITPYGCVPLHIAVERNSLALIKLLVDSGASLEKRDYGGKTSLLIACKLDNLDVVQFLVSKGANINVADTQGNTPLLLAIESGSTINVKLIQFLLNSGADPNQCNQIGCTPLLATIKRSNQHLSDGGETVQALIDHNCDINVRDYQVPYFGESALNVAITHGQDVITEKLIRSGANVDERNNIGMLPFVRLIKEGKNDLAKLALASSKIAKLDIESFENDHETISKIDPELFEYLNIKERTFFPKLKQLSRVNFRNYFGRNSDQVIQELKIPLTLKKYLLLQEL